MVGELIKSAVRRLPVNLQLRLYGFYHLRLIRKGLVGKELDQLMVMAGDRRRVAIDIGANKGVYTYFFARNYHAVKAFEPNASCTHMLKSYARNQGKVSVFDEGLSNTRGRQELFVPKDQSGKVLSGLASLNDPGGERLCLDIPILPLDDHEFTSVDLIKIDVEGHEWEVVGGAEKTIRDNRPLLFIEIEQRHQVGKTVSQFIDYVKSFGYQAYFFEEGAVVDASTFSYARHQKPFLSDPFSTGYVNNFIFVPLESEAN